MTILELDKDGYHIKGMYEGQRAAIYKQFKLK